MFKIIDGGKELGNYVNEKEGGGIQEKLKGF